VAVDAFLGRAPAAQPELVAGLVEDAGQAPARLRGRRDEQVAREVGDVGARHLALQPVKGRGGDPAQGRVGCGHGRAHRVDHVGRARGVALDDELQRLGVGQAVREGGELTADALLVVRP